MSGWGMEATQVGVIFHPFRTLQMNVMDGWCAVTPEPAWDLVHCLIHLDENVSTKRWRWGEFVLKKRDTKRLVI